jgi:hypothetical protein
MKYLVAATCVALAVALSVLGPILATGRVPGQPPPQPRSEAHGAEVAAQPVVKRGNFSISSGRDRMADERSENLKKEKEKLPTRVKDLAEKEAQTQQQKAIMAQFGEADEGSQAKLKAGTAEIPTAEAANIRHPAEMHSKTNPAGASSLLEQYGT